MAKDYLDNKVELYKQIGSTGFPQIDALISNTKDKVDGILNNNFLPSDVQTDELTDDDIDYCAVPAPGDTRKDCEENGGKEIVRNGSSFSYKTTFSNEPTQADFQQKYVNASRGDKYALAYIKKHKKQTEYYAYLRKMKNHTVNSKSRTWSQVKADNDAAAAKKLAQQQQYIPKALRDRKSQFNQQWQKTKKELADGAGTGAKVLGRVNTNK